MKWPWTRSIEERIHAAERIVEAERDLREAQIERAKVDVRKARSDEFIEAMRDSFRGKGNGHAPVRR